MATPSVGALLFEIRQQKRIGTAYKYRYTQTDDPSQKMAFVKSWKETHQKKALLKLICRSFYLKDAKKEGTSLETPKKEVEMEKKENTSQIPKPPAIPSWLIRSAVSSTLKQRLPTQKTKPLLCIPEPPPLPLWLVPKNSSPAAPTSPPRPKPAVLHENSSALRSARKLLRSISVEEGMKNQQQQNEQQNEQKHQQQRTSRALGFVR